LSFNCDRAEIVNGLSEEKLEVIKEVLERAIQKVHERAYKPRRGGSDDVYRGEGCCGDTRGGEMAEMSLASQDAYDIFMDGM